MAWAFDYFELARRLAEGHFERRRQMLQIARTTVVLPDQRDRGDDIAHRGFDQRFQHFHADRRNLADHDTAETVQYQSRQPVRLAEHPAMMPRETELLAQS